MLTIGLTGGVGAGKSLLLAFLHDKYNAFVIEADKVGHQVMEPGMPCYEPVIALFGPGVIKNDKTLDRRAISDIVFTEAEKRKQTDRSGRKAEGGIAPAADKRQQLDDIIHPAVKRVIREELEKEAQSGRKLAVVEAALLLEDNYQAFCDEVWYVYVDADTRVKRLMDGRGYTEEKARSIMAAQKPDSFYRGYASFVIDNSGDPEKAMDQISERLTAYEIL